MPDLTLQRYMTRDVFQLKDSPLGPGTYTKTLEIRGNAILSSIFVKSIDPGATIKVNYFQTTSGTIDDPERFDLNSHPLISATGTNQIAVTRIHNKPVIEVVITGGNVEFGVYLTVNDELATDIDSALVSDGQDAELATDKGIPIACYDSANDEWMIIRCPLPVTLSEDGTPVHRAGSITNSNMSNNPNPLDSFNIPAGKTYRFKKIIVSTRVSGVFTLKAASAIIARGRTGPASMNSVFQFDPYKEVAAGTAMSLTFDQVYQTPSDCNVDWFIMATAVDP